MTKDDILVAFAAKAAVHLDTTKDTICQFLVELPDLHNDSRLSMLEPAILHLLGMTATYMPTPAEWCIFRENDKGEVVSCKLKFALGGLSAEEKFETRDKYFVTES